MKIFKLYFVILLFMLGTILVASVDDYQQFCTDMLELHNKYRAMHGAKKMVLDDDLFREAETYAAKLDDEVYLSWKFGINTYYDVKDAKLDVNKVFLKWYNQGTNHDYSHSHSARLNNLQTRAFTQIVWKDTTQLGVAVARTDEFLKVVAIYSPRGNTPNGYKSNVSNLQVVSEEGNAAE